MTGHGLRRSAILFLLLALALSSRMGAQSGHELFQQALSKERAEGQLQEAIALYQRVVEVAGADHALAAKALLQLGRCYEALGNTEARKAYERLIARYPDQTDMVAQARSRLASLTRTPAPAAPAAMTVRPLPGLSAPTALLALSPDGTSAIVMDFSKGQNLALYEFAKKQTRLLTDLDWLMGYTLFAAWSPDGRRVAYLYVNLKAESELRVMTLDGRSNVVYRAEGVPAVQPVGWTPDGATLVVVTARPDKTWALGTLPATGGPFTPLRSLGWSYDWRDGPPRLSPDGRLIAYLEGERGLRDVHVLTLDGRDAYRVTDDPADDLAPIWSPDGRHLVFTSNRQNTVSLWAVELKEGKPLGPPVKLKDGMQSARLIDWTARGIFYDQQTTTRDLFTVAMDPIEGRATGSPRQIPYSRTGRNVSPVWSPDGGRLAFVSSATTEPNRRYVVVMPADGGQAREFLIPTTTWEYTQSPYDLRWFGDGRGLGFSGTDTRGVPAVFRLRLETGEWDTIPMAMADAEFGMRTEWNRDGSAFYFARRMPANAGIFERAVNGDAERLIYRSTPSMFRSLEFSPDRKWLAFQQRTAEANYRGRSRVLIVDIETGETRTVLEEGSSLNDRWPLNLVGWTPSGSLLVERFGTGGAAPEALLAPVNGGAPRSFEVPSFGSTGTPEPQPDLVAKWSPDGRSMVLVRMSRGGEAFVIEHPLAGVRATTVGR